MLILTSVSKQVSDFYKRPNAESPAKAALDETSNMFENRGVQMLGQIKHGSCRPRAILFKVLADTVGLESRLMVVRFCWWAQLLLLTLSAFDCQFTNVKYTCKFTMHLAEELMVEAQCFILVLPLCSCLVG